MKTNSYRSHPVAGAVAAAIITAFVVSTLVESFEPAQLLRFERNANGDEIAFERRADGEPQAA